MKKNRKNKNKNGFSFIEGIFAAFIVTGGMIAVIQLMTANLTSSFNSRNEIMASFLAQEGIEVVRNIRDNNWAKSLPTFDNSTFPGADKDNCRVDMLSTDVKTCDSSDKILRINTQKKYLYDGSSPYSRFQRKIIINYDTGTRSSANYATVISVVVWDGSFPPGAININTCNQVNKCVFASITLRKWGE